VTYPVSYGAITSLYMVTAPASGELNGKVGISASRIGHGVSTVTAWARVTLPHKKALNPELEKKTPGMV